MKYSMIRKGAVSVLVAGMMVAGMTVGGTAAYAVDTAALEGNQMAFTVTLGRPTFGWELRYQYSTRDGSATQGTDYTAATGTVNFIADVTQQTIHVNTLDDIDVEGPETFQLRLYNPEVNGLYRGVDGWVELTDAIEGIPHSFTYTGQIMDNDSARSEACTTLWSC